MFIYFLNENQFSNLEPNFQYWNYNYYFFNLMIKEVAIQEKVEKFLEIYLVRFYYKYFYTS